MLHSTADLIARNRRSRTRKRNLVIGLLLVIVVALFLITLMLGQSFTPPKDVVRVLLGADVQGQASRLASCACRAPSCPCWRG